MGLLRRIKGKAFKEKNRVFTIGVDFWKVDAAVIQELIVFFDNHRAVCGLISDFFESLIWEKVNSDGLAWSGPTNNHDHTTVLLGEGVEWSIRNQELFKRDIALHDDNKI